VFAVPVFKSIRDFLKARGLGCVTIISAKRGDPYSPISARAFALLLGVRRNRVGDTSRLEEISRKSSRVYKIGGADGLSTSGLADRAVSVRVIRTHNCSLCRARPYGENAIHDVISRERASITR